MLVIEYGDVFCKLVSGKPLLLAKRLRYKDPNARFSPQYRYGDWDGKVSFWDPQLQRFPTGLLEDTEKRLRAKKIPYRIVRTGKVRKPVPLADFTADCLHGIDLREHQMEGCKSAIRAERGWLWHATNAGKTAQAAALSQHLLRHVGGKVVIMVPTANLCISTSREIKKFVGSEFKVGAWGAGNKSIGDITVVTAGSLIRGVPSYVEKHRAKAARKRTWKKRRSSVALNKTLRDLLLRATVLIIDEGHHASAATWQAILGFTPARFRIGITGSLKNGKDRIRDLTLKAYVGPVISRVKNKTLIDKGISAKPLVFRITDESVHDIDHTAEHWERNKSGKYVLDDNGDRIARPGTARYKDEASSVVTDKNLNSAIVALAHACVVGNFKPLVLTADINHIHRLARRCEKKGLRPISVWGDVDPNVRVKSIQKFSKLDDAVMLGSTVFDEGVNAPSVGALFIAGVGKSVRQLLQRVGRSLRRKEGVNMVLIFDTAPVNGKLLQKHTEERFKVYRQEGFEIVDVPDVEELCRKLRKGWKGVLGTKRYEKERALTKRQSETLNAG